MTRVGRFRLTTGDVVDVLTSGPPDLAGELVHEGTASSMDGGRGYLEKDWGAAFPAGYVWLQTNHFSDPATCLTGSIAVIPWLRSEFPGHIVGLKHEPGVGSAQDHGQRAVDERARDHAVDLVEPVAPDRDRHRRPGQRRHQRGSTGDHQCHRGIHPITYL